MRIAVISDIHGNLAALDEVLADIERRGADISSISATFARAPYGRARLSSGSRA
jgi:hypothetical protein